MSKENLTCRINYAHGGLTESFTHDNLNRLFTYNVFSPSGAEPPLTVSYAPNGNITSKTDAGTYTYDPSKPHAVQTVTDPNNLMPLTQNITYTPFNKPDKVTEGDYELLFTYGPEQQRKKTVLNKLGNPQRTITYSGNYEKITADDGNTYEVHYLTGGAINVRKNGDAASDQMFYVYTDHLGSLNTITNAGGIKVYEQNFDPWGRKRDPDELDYDLSNYSTPALPAGTHDPKKWLIRGFTGHEHNDEVGLINMNARMYDPVVGRMLSPDNFVQDATSTQGYNRYSYALNNPLVYTDPSGEFLAGGFFAIAFAGEFLSNGINGYGWSAKAAYNSANTTIGNINNVGQVPIYQGENTTVTAGLDPFNFGVSVNAYHTQGDWSFRGSAGVGMVNTAYAGGGVSYTSGDFTFGISGGASTGNLGFIGETRNYTRGGPGSQVGGGVTYHDQANDQYFTGGLTYFGGNDEQWNWYAGYRKGDFSLATTNDVGLGGDKFRTAAAEVGIGNVSYGINLYTTKPPESEYERGEGRGENFTSMWGRNSKGTYSSGSRIYAGMYLGYNNGTSISRVGVNAPWVQDFFQNGIHRIIGSPYFNTNYGPPSGLFLKNGVYSPYSLY